MSANRPSRHHSSIKYASADHDRLKRALLQPVQPWDRKLAYPSHGSKRLKIFKWVKSDRKIKFDDDEGEEESLRNMVSEDISTPTASIIQPLTAASTPQPSEPEPDSTPNPPYKLSPVIK